MYVGVRVRSWCVGREAEGHGGYLGRGAFAAFVIVFLVFVIVARIVVMVIMVMIMIKNVNGMTMITIPIE